MQPETLNWGSTERFLKLERVIGKSVACKISRCELSLLLATLVLATSAAAQKNFSQVAGDVQNKNEKPVEGVCITLENKDYGIFLPTTTNSEGLYHFFDLRPLPGYKVTARVPGDPIKYTSKDPMPFSLPPGGVYKVRPFEE